MQKLYDKFIHSARLNRYGKKLLLPKLVVFYNGTDKKEDECTLSLSDAFKEEIRQNVLHKYSGINEKTDESQIQAKVEQIFHDANPNIEVKVRMININHGHNREMLSKCRPLGEYAWFVAQVRDNQANGSSTEDDKQTGISRAIDRAIDEMPEDFEIKKFITANRAEVKDMCLTEYNEAEAMEMLKEEGRQKSRLLFIKNLMDS